LRVRAVICNGRARTTRPQQRRMGSRR
jgi:hypothetical protein